ncbi:MAG: hypothetical protein ACRD2A_24895 [Vicinamibacterales bacterium]
MVKADSKTTAEESWLLNALADNIASMDGGAKAVASFRAMVDFDEIDILARLAVVSKELRQQVYETARVTAAIDHEFHRKERTQLQRIADACEIKCDPIEVERLLERYTV